MTSVHRDNPGRQWLVVVMLVALAGCGKEVRSIEAGPPQTPPMANNDPRVQKYEGNFYQVSQGGRYFTWYGCGACHALGATHAPNFTDGRWRHGSTFEAVYRSIDHGHVGLQVADGRKIPVEQLWEITAFVRDLSQQPAEKRHRQDNDQQGEPQGQSWTGAVR